MRSFYSIFIYFFAGFVGENTVLGVGIMWHLLILRDLSGRAVFDVPVFCDLCMQEMSFDAAILQCVKRTVFDVGILQNLCARFSVIFVLLNRP